MPRVHGDEDSLLIPHNWSIWFQTPRGSNHSIGSSTYKQKDKSSVLGCLLKVPVEKYNQDRGLQTNTNMISIKNCVHQQ